MKRYIKITLIYGALIGGIVASEYFGNEGLSRIVYLYGWGLALLFLLSFVAIKKIAEKKIEREHNVSPYYTWPIAIASFASMAYVGWVVMASLFIISAIVVDLLVHAEIDEIKAKIDKAKSEVE